MRRRAVLSGVGTGIAAIAGCVGTSGRIDPGERTSAYPDLPAELTPETTVDYVARYEEARVHEAYAGDDVSDLTVSTAATFDYTADGGYHVSAYHAGTVTYEGDGETVVGELYSTPIPYRVDPRATAFAPVDRHSVETDTTGEEAGTGDAEASVEPPLGVRIVNFSDRDGRLRVTVRADGRDDPRVLDTTVDVDGGTAAEIPSISDIAGTYHVVARLSAGGLTGVGRADVELPGVKRGPDVDVLLSPDGLSTRSLPPIERV